MHARHLLIFAFATVFALTAPSPAEPMVAASIDATRADGSSLNTSAVLPGTSILARVSGAQSNTAFDLTRVQLNWAASSPGLELDAASWVWHPDTDPINGLADDADMSDLLVNRQGGVSPGTGITDASFVVGTLAFDAPTEEGAYALSLSGGQGADVTVWAEEGTTFFLEGDGLELDEMTFTVVPEPCSLVILLSGLTALRRRRNA